MSDQVSFEGKTFYHKIQKMLRTWNQCGSPEEALVFSLGKTSNGTQRPLTSDFFLWLIDYELPETVMLLTKAHLVFAVSAKKKTMLEAMQVPQDYDGPKLELLVRDIKQDNTSDVIGQLVSHIPSNSKVGIFTKDATDGDLTKKLLEGLQAQQAELTDFKDLFEQINMTKLKEEVENLNTAAEFVKWTFQSTISEIEGIIESNKKAKHEAIAKKIESVLDSKNEFKKFLSTQPHASAEFFEYPLGIYVQSGNQFVLNKINVTSDDKFLNFENVYANVLGKYKDMHVMASRTLIINPDKEGKQKRGYLSAYEAIDLLCKNLVVGEPIKKSYLAVREYYEAKYPDLAPHLHSNFGFGIGFGIKEDKLVINESNETLVQPNMCFHVRITIQKVHEKPSRSIIAIGETVLVDSQGQVNILTQGIFRKFGQISYTIEDDESSQDESKMQDVTQNKKKPEPSKAPQNGSRSNPDQRQGGEERQTRQDLIQSTRLRQKNVVQNSENQDRKKTQDRLLALKLEEQKRRYENGEIVNASKKEKQKKMGNVQAYNSEKSFPKDIKPGQLYVDDKADCILVPVNQNSFVPFHVATIKNVSTNQEGQWCFLRLNFHIPAGSMDFPIKNNEPQHLFVKELTLKNMNRGGDNHLMKAFKLIKDLIKKVKTQEVHDENSKQEEKQDVLEELSLIKGKKDSLDGLVIRPNIVGKKTVGNLEIHSNGVRFCSQKGHNVDIAFSNIKHAFFQPCGDDELIVIIHFNLKAPIMVGTKKVQDVQFFKEAGAAADDLDQRHNRRRLNDMDELEQEERERQQKEKLNKQFATFVKQIEQTSERNKNGAQVEFDIPFEDLDFSGCPHKSVVKIRPTKNCLIAISEFPFFVIDISDIEHVHFERVQFGNKSFDMAIIFKDFITFKRISSIPIEHIEDVKPYFDEIEITYSEGAPSLNWTNVLSQLREDFEAFLEGNGWRFLIDDDDGSGDEEAEDEDEEFSLDEEGEEESSESDYSDDDDDDDYSSSEFDDEEDLSEEGMDWEDMEKEAEEEDRRAAARRQGRDPPPQPAKKRGGAQSGRR